MKIKQTAQASFSRRDFFKTGGILMAGFASMGSGFTLQEAKTKKVSIKDIRIENGVVIEASDGTFSQFKGSSSQDSEFLRSNLPAIKKLLTGKDPLDRKLDGEMIWEAIYPGKARLYANGKDPVTGEIILNKPRPERQSPTGKIFIAISTIDLALWDLRGKLLGKPAYKIIGNAQRSQVPVYWRPGEATMGLDEACHRAREAFDTGYHYQKWYFAKSAKDGKEGFKENVELARRLREELPDAHLMFDNHSIRYFADVDYSVELCKAVAQYKPFWIEEPVCPECVDGYARIKDETGVTIAGGEHLYTRWPVKAFLDRKCIDYLQCDPVWCGGISEWLKICNLAKNYQGVKVVPHITSPWIVAPHCVASQPEEICPILEYNVESGKSTLDSRMSRTAAGTMVMNMPETPGLC
jgi:L-alanine-DL-glutamate epimerase-like enolase superfamily enzyme